MDTHERVFDPLGDPKDGHLLTRAIIDTIREPLIVLDEDLRIIVASGSFYKKFGLTHENTQGKLFYDLGDGQSEDVKDGPRGLGTSIIGALANQLQAMIRTESSADGTKVSIVHATI